MHLHHTPRKRLTASYTRVRSAIVGAVRTAAQSASKQEMRLPGVPARELLVLCCFVIAAAFVVLSELQHTGGALSLASELVAPIAPTASIRARPALSVPREQRRLFVPPAARGKAESTDSACVPEDYTNLPSCDPEDRRARSFLLVFMGHSGSTAIITALKEHSETYIDGLEPVDHGQLGNDTNRALKFADEFFTEGHRRGKTAGFKIRPRHLLKRPKAWKRLMRKHKTRLIWNYRSNLFKQAIGHYPIAFHNSTAAFEGLVVDSKSATTAASSRPEVKRLVIDNMRGLSDLLRKRMEGEALVDRALRRLTDAGRGDSCTLPLSYESLLSDDCRAVVRAQAFLGLRMDEVHRPLRRKATLDNLCELLENHDEVCNAFFSCPDIRWMLDDPANDCSCATIDKPAGAASREFCPKFRRR